MAVGFFKREPLCLLLTQLQQAVWCEMVYRLPLYLRHWDRAARYLKLRRQDAFQGGDWRLEIGDGVGLSTHRAPAGNPLAPFSSLFLAGQEETTWLIIE